MKKIAIHSVPRSGSSWVGQVFNSSPLVNFKYQPLFSYAFKDYLDEHSSAEKINQFFQQIAESDDDFLNQKEQIRIGHYPTFTKHSQYSFTVYKEVRYHFILKNLLDKTDDLKVIAIIRNPLAVLDSWWKAPKEFRKDLGWNIFEEWRYAPKKNLLKREEYNGFEKWKEAAFLFETLQKHYPDRFYLLKYQDLLSTPTETIKDVFTFCAIPFEKTTEDFIKESTTKNNEVDAYSVYRKTGMQDNKWENSLPSEIIDLVIQDLKDTELSKYL